MGVAILLPDLSSHVCSIPGPISQKMYAVLPCGGIGVSHRGIGRVVAEGAVQASEGYVLWGCRGVRTQPLVLAPLVQPDSDWLLIGL